MTDHTSGPRLGAALIIGATAERCVYVHTDPAGIAAIWEKLRTLNAAALRQGDGVPVVVVLGAVFGRDAIVDECHTIPAGAADELAAAALEVNR